MNNQLAKPSAAKQTYVTVWLLFSAPVMIWWYVICHFWWILVHLWSHEHISVSLSRPLYYIVFSCVISCCVHIETVLLSSVKSWCRFYVSPHVQHPTSCKGVKWRLMWCVLILCSSYHQNQGTETHDIMIDSEAGCVVCNSSLPICIWTDVIIEVRF